MKKHDVDNDCKEDEDIQHYNDYTSNNCEKKKRKNVEEYHHGNKGSGSVHNHDDKKEENPEDPSFITKKTICQIKSHGIPIHAKIFEINRSTQIHYVNTKTKI